MKYIILLLLLTGCYTEKKATEQVNKANEKFPKIVAELARDKYPCTDLLKNDTAVIFKDTTIYVDCPDTTQVSPYEVTITDTVNRVVTKTIRFPVHLPVQIKTITKWYEDSAKLKLTAIELGGLKTELSKVQAKNEALTGKLKTRTKQALWLLLLCIGLTVWTLRKLFI